MLNKPVKDAQYGSWTVVKVMPSKSLCRCVCGTEKLVANYSFLNGRSTQCTKCSDGNKEQKWHSFCSSSRIYQKLSNAARCAIKRCSKDDYDQYEDYKGRGISVYGPWVADPDEFVKYLCELPGHDDETLVLDRVDNDGNYEPGNLRFTTHSESQLNRRCGDKERKYPEIGDVYGRWKVVDGPTEGYLSLRKWLCECLCGRGHWITAHDLVRQASWRCRICARNGQTDIRERMAK